MLFINDIHSLIQTNPNKPNQTSSISKMSPRLIRARSGLAPIRIVDSNNKPMPPAPPPSPADAKFPSMPMTPPPSPRQ